MTWKLPIIAGRDTAYGEVVERAPELLTELKQETARGNATYAEVEESEADLERFGKWLALRSVVRRSGIDAVRAQWPGTDDGFAALARLIGFHRAGNTPRADCDPHSAGPRGRSGPERRPSRITPRLGAEASNFEPSTASTATSTRPASAQRPSTWPKRWARASGWRTRKRAIVRRRGPGVRRSP